MFNKIIRILIVIISIQNQFIFSLDSADLCSSSIKCKGKHNYRCAQDLCGLNEKTCSDYYKYIQAYVYRSIHIVIKFQSSIRSCQINSESSSSSSSLNELNRSLYCFNRKSNCFKKQYLLSKTGFKSVNKKIDCKCESKRYSFKCGSYCTLENKYCDLLLNNNQYQSQQFNTTGIQVCARK